MRLGSPAKINLYLAVGERTGDGYHRLDTLYQTVDLSDEVTIEESDQEPAVTAQGPYAADVPLDESNLVLRAVHVFAQATGTRVPNLHIHLDKRVPAGAGLGGGSGNAAAVLRALRSSYAPAVADRQLLQIAATIGSDVPFQIGGGTAIGTGRGEVLQQLEDLPPLGVLLLAPPVRLNTKDVYARLDGLRAGRKALTPSDPLHKIDAIIPTLRTRGCVRLRNDLELAAIDLAPEIGGIRPGLERLGALAASMTGSGSAFFALFPDRERAKKALQEAEVGESKAIVTQLLPAYR